jgi:3-oxoacyl-(acyl-carrier-protein) synthase
VRHPFDAVGTAARFIQGGLADVAVCGASEWANFEIDFRPALHQNRTSFGMVTPTTDPTKACRPFDRDRGGIAGGDATEIKAINKVHGSRGTDLLATSLKGHFGHPGGSAAALNLAAALIGMGPGEVLPTASTEHPDPEIGDSVVLGKPRQTNVDALQLNAFGFGGQNASLVITPN